MEKHEQAEKDYIAGMKYREIAEKYGVSLNTVKSWKKRHEWIRSGEPHKNKEAGAKERVHPKSKKGAHKNEPDPEIESEEVSGDLPEGADLKNQHKEFCAYFVKHYNATKAYQKVYGCGYYAAAVGANRLLKNAKIQACIKEMQQVKLNRAALSREDILQRYIDIAYTDVNDYYDIAGGAARLKDGAEIDGTLATEVKIFEEGATVKLPSISDRLKALEKLQGIIEEQQSESDGTVGNGALGVFEIMEGEE